MRYASISSIMNHKYVSLALSFLFFVAICSGCIVSAQPPVDVLLYTSDGDIGDPEDRYPAVALRNLGFDYTNVGSDANALISQLAAQSWTLVIIDEPSQWAHEAWDEVSDYVATGGLVLHSVYGMSNDPSHSLWTTLGVSYVENFYEPVDPIYQWAIGHPIFTTPNAIANPLTNFMNDWADDGDLVTAIGDGTAIAGNTTTPSVGGLLVVANGGRTVFNGFLWAEMDNDSDTDGKPDAVELIENEIMFVLQASGALSVGGEILPTNTLLLVAPYLLILVVATSSVVGILHKKRVAG